MPKRALFLFLFLSLTCALSFAQSRSYNEDHIEAYRKEKRFDYPSGPNEITSTDYGKNTTSSSFDEKTVKKEVVYEPKKTGGFSISSLFVWIIALSILAIIVFLIVRNIRPRYKQDSEAIEMDIDDVENIHETDFERLLREAISKKLFRRAVRLLYLESLKKLSDKNFIQWEESKTNSEYVYEIKAKQTKQLFVALTSVFEYVWYGYAPLDEHTFYSVQEQFKHFQNHLK